MHTAKRALSIGRILKLGGAGPILGYTQDQFERFRSMEDMVGQDPFPRRTFVQSDKKAVFWRRRHQSCIGSETYPNHRIAIALESDRTKKTKLMCSDSLAPAGTQYEIKPRTESDCVREPSLRLCGRFAGHSTRQRICRGCLGGCSAAASRLRCGAKANDER